MASIIVNPLTPATINQSGTDDVNFTAAGTLNIAGTAAAPISVTLSKVAGAALGTTINISNADVQLNGTAGVSAITAYNVGAGGTLRLNSTLNVGAGSTIDLSGSNSALVVGSGADLGAFSAIGGFGPGKTIDLTGLNASRVAYADRVGTNTGGTLTLYGANNAVVSTLNLGDGEYTAANFKLAGDGAAGTLLSFASAVTGTMVSSGSTTLGPGDVATFGVSLSNPVVVTGTPTLTLNDGGVATFDSAASTASRLVFNYTVAPGQNTPGLTVTAVNTNAATLLDAAGNPLNLNSIINDPLGVAVDTVLPTLTSLATDPVSGQVGVGQTVTFTAAISEPVTVTGGTPSLTLSDGGTATFDPTGSTPTSLAFRTTVQAGQNTSDLAVTGASLNGATVADAANNALDLASLVTNPPGILTVGLTQGMGTTTTGGTTTGGTSTGSTGIGSTGTTGTDTGTAGTGTTTGSIGATTPSYGTIPIYRFFESTNGTHFYTPSANERAQILQTRPDLIPEGQNGVGLTAVDPASGDPNAVQVFRFFDSVHGTQFLTASATERDTVLATRSDLTYEPNGSFFEHTQPQAGDTAVYRFFSSTDGTHFYTDSANERATILQTRPDLIAEGVGFYEPKHT